MSKVHSTITYNPDAEEDSSAEERRNQLIAEQKDQEGSSYMAEDDDLPMPMNAIREDREDNRLPSTGFLERSFTTGRNSRGFGPRSSMNVSYMDRGATDRAGIGDRPRGPDRNYTGINPILGLDPTEPEPLSPSRREQSPTLATIRSDWLNADDDDLGFLDEMMLEPSEDEVENQANDKRVDLQEFELNFFKLLHKIRKNKLILNSQLPKEEKHSRWKRIFTSKNSFREIDKCLKRCHDRAKLLFEFQRNSLIVAIESEKGPSSEDLEINHKTHKFMVNRYSVVNSLILWDFSAFWDGDHNAQAVDDTSPYLSLTPDQWTTALDTPRPGRNFMMYQPDAVRTLRNQGGKAKERSTGLEAIYTGRKITNLVLAEYIYMNRTNLMNGDVYKGGDVQRTLKRNAKNKKLFDSLSRSWERKMINCEFYLNPPARPGEFIEYLKAVLEAKPNDKLKTRRMIICDPVHWTLYTTLLLNERKKALIMLLTQISQAKELWQNEGEEKKRVTEIKTLAQDQASKLRKTMAKLPPLEQLKEYGKRKLKGKFLASAIETEPEPLCLSDAVSSFVTRRELSMHSGAQRKANGTQRTAR